MKILIVDMCYEKNSLFHDEFVNPVENILINLDKKINIDYDIIHFLDLDNQIIKKYDKIILCGTSLKDFEYLNHIEKFEWIKNYPGYILGICAGAQIIAKIFGSKIEEFEEIGLIKIEKIKEDKILNQVSLKEVYALHKSFFNIPKGFELILQTKIPQLISNGKIYASLFHPEIRNKKLIENFINL